MAQYMFSVHSVEGGGGPVMTEEEMQQGWQKINILEEEMKSANALVFWGLQGSGINCAGGRSWSVVIACGG